MNPAAKYKILASVGAVVLALLGCWAGRKLTLAGKADGSGLEAVLQVGNTFAAGILLAASLVHMLPDAFEALGPYSDFPLASVFTGVAFIFLIFLGEVVENMIFTFDEDDPEAAMETYQASLALAPRKELMTPRSVEIAPALAKGLTRGFSSLQAGSPSALTPGGAAKARFNFARQQSMARTKGLVKQGTFGNLSDPFLPIGQKVKPSSAVGIDPGASGSITEEGGLEGADLDNVLNEEKGKTTAIGEVKSFLLYFALCFHAVMEGLGMGSSQDTGMVIGVMLAVLAHKGLAAFALGCTLTQSEMSGWKFWNFVIIFGFGTPLGCLIGSLAANASAGADKSFLSGICVALSSGTFLQISSMELLPAAMANEDHRLKGLLGLTLGFAFMSTLAIWC